MTTCDYCGKPDCPTREQCSEYLRRTRGNDRAAFAYFTRALPIRGLPAVLLARAVIEVNARERGKLVIAWRDNEADLAEIAEHLHK